MNILNTKKALSAIPSALIFGLLAIAGGYFIPQTYFRYFDNTVYYEIQNPVPVGDSIHKACDYVSVYIIRKSKIDGQGDSIINLSLVRDSGESRERIFTEIKRISITKGDGTIITSWQIPCGISPGEYFFEGTVKYQVRGVDKYTPFYTEPFKVEE